MPIVTTVAAVTALWTAFEVVGQAIGEDVLSETLKPISSGVSSWVQKKTGWQDKVRQEAFRKAYQKAEAKLIKEVGIVQSYRVFHLIPAIVDSGMRENVVLAMLEDSDVPRDKLLAHVTRRTPQVKYEDRQNLEKFLKYVRQCLWETDIFRPIVEFYALEEGREVRRYILNELSELSDTIDKQFQAVRVVLVDPETDCEHERRVYLEQIEAFFEEQDFGGFELKDRKETPLLKNLYVCLHLQYESGGTAIMEELGQMIEIEQGKGEN